MADSSTPENLLETPLAAAHRAAGAKMVPFAGYDMPVQYPTGVLAEHLWTRAHAGVFDVSHMGQAALSGPDHDTVARALEALVPCDVVNLKPGQQRYTQLLAEDGGILDDLMVSRPAAEAEKGFLYLVVNASRKEADFAWIAARLPATVSLVRGDTRALIAVQGPEAVDAVAALGARKAADLPFMFTDWFELAGVRANVSRSGYTGEDGFEISLAADDAPVLWAALLKDERVKPIGLGARDSLRLEAGLCLYGHDIDEGTSPVEAGLTWSIQKRRREGGGFLGASRVQRELAEGVTRSRVGILPEGKAPAREGTAILDPATGHPLGTVTSGGFAPSLNGPIAMGYVPPTFAAEGTPLHLLVRGKPLPARVATLPFVPHRYARTPKSSPQT
jgi:aminomethyltransferase